MKGSGKKGQYESKIEREKQERRENWTTEKMWTRTSNVRTGWKIGNGEDEMIRGAKGDKKEEKDKED